MTKFEEAYERLSDKEYRYIDINKVYEDLAILNEEYHDLLKELNAQSDLIDELETTLRSVKSLL